MRNGGIVRDGGQTANTYGFTAFKPFLNQYGIRTVVGLGGEALGDTVNDTASMGIKFEIVPEARIELATPAAADTLCGVAT